MQLEVLVGAPPFVLVVLVLVGPCIEPATLGEARLSRMKGIVRGLSRAPLAARWSAEYSTLMSVARLELHCRWGSVGSKNAAAQGGMAGGAQARALACGAAGMPDGGRGPVAGSIDAQRRPEEAGAGVRGLPRPSDIFETRQVLSETTDENLPPSASPGPYCSFELAV